MHPRLASAVVALALGALITAGCGVESGEEGASSSETTTTESGSSASTTPDEGEPDDVPSSEEEEMAVDMMTEIYTDMGFEPDQAQCLAEGVAEIMGEQGEDFDPTDTSSIMDVVNECDIPMSQMMELGEGTDGTLEGGFKLGLKSSLETQGLTEEQAECVAQGYIDQFGTDVEPSTDPDKMIPLFESCGA